jgi:hypothetical protein
LRRKSGCRAGAVAGGRQLLISQAARGRSCKRRSAGSDQGNLCRRQGAVLARRQLRIEGQRTDAFAMKADDFVLEVPEHALDLMIASLDDAQAGAARGEQLQQGRLGGEVFEGKVQAPGERVDVPGVDDLFGLHVVDLGPLSGGLGQASRPLAVIGEQQQAGGVVVQATGQVQLELVRLIEQIQNGRVPGVDGGTDATLGFVQHEVARRSATLQNLIVQFDAAELAYLAQWVDCDQAIDPHAPTQQQQARLLAIEMRQAGKETVETHGQVSGR